LKDCGGAKSGDVEAIWHNLLLKGLLLLANHMLVSVESFNNGTKNLFRGNPTDLAHLRLLSNHKAAPLSRSSLLRIMISPCCLGFVPYVNPLKFRQMHLNGGTNCKH